MSHPFLYLDRWGKALVVQTEGPRAAVRELMHRCLLPWGCPGVPVFPALACELSNFPWTRRECVGSCSRKTIRSGQCPKVCLSSVLRASVACEALQHEVLGSGPGGLATPAEGGFWHPYSHSYGALSPGQGLLRGTAFEGQVAGE